MKSPFSYHDSIKMNSLSLVSVMRVKPEKTSANEGWLTTPSLVAKYQCTNLPQKKALKTKYQRQASAYYL